jgi:hypothetical protein
MNKIVFLLLLLMAVTVITGCSTNSKSNYATGQVYNQYNPPPGAGIQGNPSPPPPLASGGGCGI